MAQPVRDPARTEVHSYEFLRRAIGVIGLALPWVLAVGTLLLGGGTRGSISEYYYSDMRDVFVGSMCAVGVFLLSYRGYTKLDDIASDTAAVGAIGLALFPTTPPGARTSTDNVIGGFHAGLAGLFFLTLAAFCLYFFTRSDRPQDQRNPRKNVRNRMYRTCGVIILVCLALIAAGAFLPALDFPRHEFWEEGAAILAFGWAWFVKGDTVFRDK